MDVLPCARCDQVIEPIRDFPGPNHGKSCNEFSTYGQYGSTVFDPLNGDRMIINVCDDCLSSLMKLGYARVIKRKRP